MAIINITNLIAHSFGAMLTIIASTYNSYAATASGTAYITFTETATVTSDTEMDFSDIIADSDFDFDIKIYSKITAAEFTITTDQTASIYLDVTGGNSKITLVDFVCNDGKYNKKCASDDDYIVFSDKTINVGAKAKIIDKKQLLGTMQEPTYTMNVSYH